MVLEADSTLGFLSETGKDWFLRFWTCVVYMLYCVYIHRELYTVSWVHQTLIIAVSHKRCCDTLQPAATQIKVRTAVWYISVKKSDFFFFFLHECVWIHHRLNVCVYAAISRPLGPAGLVGVIAIVIPLLMKTQPGIDSDGGAYNSLILTAWLNQA